MSGGNVDKYENGIIFLPFPYAGTESCNRDLMPEVALWLSGFVFTEIELSILNSGLLSIGSGGTNFPIDTIGIMESHSVSAGAVWDAFLGLCEDKICKHYVPHPSMSRSYDFGISTDDLHQLAAKRRRRPKRPAAKKVVDTSDCHVYVLDNGFHRKIGISNDVPSRVKSMQTASSLPLKVVHTVLMGRTDAMRIERDLHEKFNIDRTSGEWFITPSKAIIKALQEAGGVI